MANRDANSSSTVTDKPSMALAVVSLQLFSRQTGVERAILVELKKQLVADPKCLSDDRVENYKEFLRAVDAFYNKVAGIAVLLWNRASKRNEHFNPEVDLKRIDAKAQDSLNKAKSARAKKLEGQ